MQKIFHGEYEIPLRLSGVRIVDCGANIGAFSLWAHHRFPGSQIFAYEPNPEALSFLRDNVSHLNVEINEFGLGNPGLRVLYDGTYNLGEASFHLVENNTKQTGKHIEVKSPLEMPEADILKLDVEGCEMEILSPLIEAGRRFSAIMIEYHNENFRREIDSVLSREYALTGCDVSRYYEIGTVRYVRRDLL